jgi:hypothetical protein
VLLQVVAFTILNCPAINYGKVLPAAVWPFMHEVAADLDLIPWYLKLINMDADEMLDAMAHRKPLLP